MIPQLHAHYFNLYQEGFLMDLRH